MKLEIEPVGSSHKLSNIWSYVASRLKFFPQSVVFGKMNVRQDSRFNILLTIQFNEAWERLIGGKIRFGLKRGELRLNLDGCSMPLEKLELGTLLSKSFIVERAEQNSGEVGYSLDSSLDADKFGVKGATSAKKTSNSTDRYKFNVGQVSRTGDEINPGWIFEVRTKEEILKGHFRKELLGILNVESLQGSCIATFKASLMEDLYITAGKGLWSKNLSKTRRAFLARIIAKHLLTERFGDYLSIAEFSMVESSKNKLSQKSSQQKVV